MDKVIVPILGAAYRESDSLPTRANKVTKKKDRYHLQYGVPTDIEEYTEEDLKKMKAQAEIELAEEEAEALAKLMGAGEVLNPSSAAADSAAGEATPTDEDILAAKRQQLVADLKSQTSMYLQKFQNMSTTIKVITTKAKALNGQFYIAPFIEDMNKTDKKIVALVKIFERMLTEKIKDEAIVVDVAMKVEKYDEAFMKHCDWAEKYGCAETYTASSSSRKKRARH